MTPKSSRGDGGRPSIRPNGTPWIIFHQFFSCLILRGSPDMERRCRDRSSTIRIAARKLVDPRYGGEPRFAGRRARAFSWLNVWRVKPSGGHDYGRARRSDKTPPRARRKASAVTFDMEVLRLAQPLRPYPLAFIRKAVTMICGRLNFAR